jgi:hypothetical protein
MCTPKAVMHAKAKFMRDVSERTKDNFPGESVAVSG